MNNLVEMLTERCQTDPDKAAFRVKKDGIWHSVTWAEVDGSSDRIAAGLLSLGLAPGDAVSIMGNTRLEWTLSDLAVLKARCISIGIYQTLSGEQAAYILKDSDTRLVFLENREQLEKILPHRDDLPKLQYVVIWDDDGGGQDDLVGMDGLIAKGETALSADPEIVRRVATQIKASDTALIVYTSGTTGPPKGACLTHANFMAELAAADQIPQQDMGDSMMFFLPLSHVGERIGQFMRIRRGITGAYVSDFKEILGDIAEIRPTFFASVPRIFEKAYARIRSEVAALPVVKQKIFAWAERTGREVSRRRQAGQAIPVGLALRQTMADRIVFRKVRKIFGGRVRYFLSSAAPIAVEILEFFHACGMVILEGYGQTEVSCFCTLCTPDAFRFGSVGRALPGVELKIADDGEIMVKGDIVFAGYHNQPGLNRQTLTDDGWVHTGDIGKIDPDGFLWITGRKKDIIITSGGKNVTPSNIENLLMNHPLIEYAMVHGDRRKFLSALIALSPENLPGWAAAKGYAGMDYEALSRLGAVHQEIRDAVSDTNRHLANFETIKKFIILPRPLDVETGELTPTMKVRRKIVEERYREMLDALYIEK